MYCVKCGKELEKDKNFCIECGTKASGIVEEERPLIFKIIFVILVGITCIASQEKMVHIYYNYDICRLNMKELLEFIDGCLVTYYFLITGIFGYFMAIMCVFIKKESEALIITEVSFASNIIFIGYILNELAGYLKEKVVIDVVTEYFWFFIVANVILWIYSEWCLKKE